MDDEIEPEALRAQLEDGADPTIVDVRPPAAYERAHIPGSENIPAAQLTAEIEQLDGADRVVTVCEHGIASVRAARLIAAFEGVAGPVESLAGGLEAWDGDLASADGGEPDDPPF